MAECAIFSGPLDLDESTIARHDDIKINAGLAVFDIIEVEYRTSVDDPHTDSGDTLRDDFLGINAQRNQ